MKTKQFLLVIVALVVAANVYASNTPKMSIIPLKDTKALVTASNETPVINEVSITDEYGKVVYYKRSKKKSADYKQIFNLSQLNNGSYEFKLRAGSNSIKKELSIDDGKICVKKESVEIEPYFAFENNLVKVSYLNFTKEDVKVDVYQDRKLVFTSKLGKDFLMHRALDMSELKKGNYDLVLANANNEYWFSVTR